MNRNTPSAHIASLPGGPNTKQKIKGYKNRRQNVHTKEGKKQNKTRIRAPTADQKKIQYITF